jgi:hypothetical protein
MTNVSSSTRRLWHLDPDKLRAGDVLLERGSGVRSKAIAAKDGGDFSHALMWLGTTDLIEAVGQGARVISFMRVIVEDPDQWLLLRLADDTAAARASIEARNIAHKGYNLKGALNTQLGLRLKPDPAKLFCSQLVAEAYQRAGVMLLNGVAADMVTPALLQQKSILTAMAVPLTEIPAEHMAEAATFLDRDKAYESSPMWKEMTAASEAVEAVKDRVSKLKVPDIPGIRFPPGNLHELLAVLQVVTGPEADTLAEALRQELTRRRYFELFVESILPLRMKVETDVGQYRAGTMSVEERKAFVEWRRIASFEDTRDRYRQNATVCREVYSRAKQRLWLDFASMYFTNADGLDMIVGLAAEIQA